MYSGRKVMEGILGPETRMLWKTRSIVELWSVVAEINHVRLIRCVGVLKLTETACQENINPLLLHGVSP